MFRAYEPEQGRLVAVKLFQLDLPPERVHQLVAEFEALIAADVAHPAIAAPIAAGMSGVSAYLAQDFVTAESLDTIVRHGPAPVGDVARAASQLGGGLATAAALGVVHGALHPRDVLMSSDDVRMTGIGVARALERVGAPVPVRRPYTAPERVGGEPGDPRADVYSLAALSYELLTGRRIPGPGDLTSDMLGDLSGLDRQAVRRVFSRALAESVDDRFETAMAFADALQEALGKRTRSAPGRLASRSLRLSDDAGPEPARFAPMPVEELPLLTDAMLAPAASDIIEPVERLEPIASDVAEANDIGGVVGVTESLLVPPGADGAENTEWPLGVRALPADDLSLAVGDVQPALADLKLDDAGLDDAGDEVLLARAPVPSMPPPVRTPERDETAHPVSVAPRERAMSIVIPRAAAEPPVVEPAARVGEEEGHRLSGVRPLVLALVVGVAIGVPIGVFIAPERLKSRVERAAVPAPAPAPIEGEAIREFTDRAAVRDEPVAAPATPSAAPPATAEAPTAAPPTAEPPQTAARTAEPRSPIAESRPPARTPGADRAVPNPASTRPERTAGAPQTASAGKADTGKASKPAATKAAAAPARPRPAAPAGRSAPGAARAAGPAPAVAPAAPSTEPGSLLVDSRPSGASVFLDGRLVGTTPLVLSSVARGEHAIHLERAGYQRWASSVKIVSGERSRVAASLEYR